MSKIGARRYSKLLTVSNKLLSLKDDFEGDRDILLSYGNVSFHFQLEIAISCLKRILDEC